MKRSPLLLLIATICSLSAYQAAPAAEPSDPSPQRHALLVGCTEYPNLALGLQLVGPSNDVALMHQLLTQRYQFQAQNIVTLSENAGSDARHPTRANIKREFERLSRSVRDEDQVVILLAGHGSRQPDDDPENPEDPEPDGLDEIFLPADVGRWQDRIGKVEGAIVDDEIREWLAAILARGAYVWILMDACHSGTMVRGTELEIPRQVLPSQLGIPPTVPFPAVADGEPDGAQTRGAVAVEAGDVPRSRGRLVALYAAQTTEPTVELPFPRDAKTRTRYGLLTYTVNLVLNQTTAPITYRELGQRIQQQYDRWNRLYPTPLVEGDSIDREVLGIDQRFDRSRIVLARRAPDTLVVNAGRLHGLTTGSVLAVFARAGERNSKAPLGHVKVTEARAVESVVSPIQYRDLAATRELPTGARCEVRHFEFGNQRLRVAVTSIVPPSRGVVAGPAPDNDKVKQQISDALAQLAKEESAAIAFTNDRNQADWLAVVDGGYGYLSPASGFVTGTGTALPARRGGLPPYFGPMPSDPSITDWLRDRTVRIARAQALLALGTDGSAFVDSSFRVNAELTRVPRDGGDNEQPTETVPWNNGRTLYKGDIVGFRVRNQGQDSVDVTLLFVDSDYAIHAIYPRPGYEADNRLPPGRQLPLRRARVTNAAGKEHLVVIAVRSDAAGGNPIDFSCLVQPGLEQMRSVQRSAPAMETPLGKLLQSALYAHGNTRGLDLVGLAEYSVQVISWRVGER